MRLRNIKTTPNPIRWALIFSLALVLHFASPAVSEACPTCKSSLHDGTAFAYAVSILFMMAMPFVIFSFWVTTILRLRAKMAPMPDEYK